MPRKPWAVRLAIRIAQGVAGVILLALAGTAYYAFAPLALPDSTTAFSIREGSTLRQASRQMVEARVLRMALPFEWMGRLLGKDRIVRAGNYEVHSGINTFRLLERITSGEVGQDQITIIEGWTVAQMRAVLAQHPAVRQDSRNLGDDELRQRLNVDWPSLEGAFFPDTYYFAYGTSDLEILRRAHRVLRTQLDRIWPDRLPNLPLATPYDALILASIVEKETGVEAERPLIAAVFVNRLKQGMPLQTDPTVIYGLGTRFDGNLRKQDLLTDNPYNTYLRRGLPPTPIAMPGLAALGAAMRPAPSDALYFVARGDGTSQFSRTLAEHEKAVTKYQRSGTAARQ